MSNKTFPRVSAQIAYNLWRKTYRYTVPEKERPLLEQANKTTTFFHGARVQLYQWGAGPNILLCPGWNGRASQYHRLIKSLIDRGYSVIGVDPPGHGLSSGNHTSLLEITGIIEMLSKQYDLAGFVGHSAGAMAGFSAIANGSVFKRAVFIAMPNNSKLLLLHYCQSLQLSEKTILALTQRFLHIHGQHAFTRTSPEYLCEQIKIPALLIHDESDTVVPVVHSQMIADKIPDSNLLLTHRYGHFRILNAQLVTDKICAFFHEEIIK